MLVRKCDLYAFLKRCAGHGIGFFDEVIVPVKNSSGGYSWKRLDQETEFDLTGFRTTDPLKILFYLAREQVLGKSYKNITRIIAGVKACDLKALEVLDKAMANSEFADPSYKHWRENSILISTDCTTAADSCHCNLVYGKPWPETGFDLNLTAVGEYFLLKNGSAKGEQLIRFIESHHHVEEADAEILKKVNEMRAKMSSLVAENNRDFIYPDSLKKVKRAGPSVWKNESAECVGCGACTNICPTCYCLVLNDESTRNDFIKVRSYDSCQLNGYARVAGGATPREEMKERFKNRYLCKFCYLTKEYQQLGCVGCGRCIDACPSNIEYRTVVQHALLENQTGEVEHA